MDGIIFDVDGTLWDSTEAVARSWNQAIDENTDFSLSLTADGLKSLFGKTMDEITLALFPSCPKEERDRIGYLCFDYENRLVFFTRMLHGHWKAFLRKSIFISSATASVDISKFF